MYFSALLLVIAGFGVGTDVVLEYHLSPPDKIFIRTSNDQYEIQQIEYNGNAKTVPLMTTYHMIGELHPCTKYNFGFKGKRNYSNRLQFEKEITTGIGPDPPIEIVNVTSDSTTITVIFNYTKIDCIEFIEISIPEYNLTYPYTIRNISRTIRLNSLTPCTKYNLVISASISDLKYLLYQDTVHTSAVEIDPVQNINFNQTKKLLTWPRGSCVSKYTVILKTDSIHHRNEEIRIETTQPYYDLKMLWPCSNYIAFITPNDIDDLKRNFSFQTEYEEPSQVEQIYGAMINLTLLEINWIRPSKNYECASNYIITINGDNYQTVDNALYLPNREPCDSFNVSVCSSPAKTQNCVQKIFDFSGMDDVPIGNVSNIAAITKNNITIITWDPPSFGSKCIKHYLVELNEKLTSASHNTISFTNLVPCIEYAVGIQPDYRDQLIPSPKTIYKFDIKPQTKPKPPSAPELIAATSTSLTLKSEYQNSNDKCKLTHFKFICRSQHLGTLNVTLEINDGNKTFEATFNNLKPSTNYTCHVSVRNSEMWSGGSTPNKTFSTEKRFGAKIELAINSKTESIHVSWNNINQSLVLTIIKLNHNYGLPENCVFEKYEEQFKIRWFKKQYNIQNLEPATNYSIQMEIHMIDDTKEYTNIFYSSTKSGHPPKVLNAQVLNKTIDPRSVTIKWDLPCRLNGSVHQTELNFIGSGINNSPVHSFSHTISIDLEKPKQNYFYTDASINPDYRYNVSITTIMNQIYFLSSDPVIVDFVSPPKMPALYKLNDWASIAAEPDSKIQIFLNIKPNRRSHFNSVHNTTLLIANLAECEGLDPAYKLFDLDHSIYKSPVSSNQNCIAREYRAYSTSSRYMIGDCIDPKTECKQPLKPFSSYQILMRAYTSRGSADTNPILFHTTGETDLTLIIVSICLVFLILTIGSSTMLWFYKTQIKDDPIQIASKQIDVKNFNALLDTNVITGEYDDISKMDLSKIQKSIGLKHRRKNRYVDILPYDFNRVVLTPNEFNRVDYINASYINGFKHKNKFIAAQGPTNETAYDFWLMVVENKCHQIVMVTQLFENEVNKCFQYYPNFNEDITFNDLTIRNVNETDLQVFIRRTLLVSRGKTKRLVIHYQFIKWPDHGCPENEMDLIKFVEFIRSENSSPEPIVVHCSAGVGRTGTFIALDIVMDEMKRNYIDICRVVRQLRKQRIKSVQTIEQYKFLYACVDQFIKEINSTE